jgi:threonine synthase
LFAARDRPIAWKETTIGQVHHLECTRCRRQLPADRLQSVCPDCGLPLFARYDLEEAGHSLKQETLRDRQPSMWRYAEVLPTALEDAVTLGEGWTPLLHVERLGKSVGVPDLWIKEEGVNPTGSFKARGLSAAVSAAKQLGVRDLVVPSAGNAGGATAAYAARAGLTAHVLMPLDVPASNRIECEALGADVQLMPGLISDCGREAAALSDAHGWFNVATLKEPFRIEGKKTMGYELAEQLDWVLPDVILYPTGGGTGLIGMWKAFEEMESLGWIDSRRPRMVVVQAEGCAPIVRAWEAGASKADPWEGAQTVAAGLRVPSALGDFLMLEALHESGGCAVAVSDEELMAAVPQMGESTGVFAAPEGAATLAALQRLVGQGVVTDNDRVVLFNTGSGLKYLHLFGTDGAAG